MITTAYINLWGNRVGAVACKIKAIKKSVYFENCNGIKKTTFIGGSVT
jgi:hypothetical protein